MKLSLLLIALFTLSGCSFAIDGWEIRQAILRCEKLSGVESISKTYLVTTVVCGDGTLVEIKRPASAYNK